MGRQSRARRARAEARRRSGDGLGVGAGAGPGFGVGAGPGVGPGAGPGVRAALDEADLQRQVGTLLTRGFGAIDRRDVALLDDVATALAMLGATPAARRVVFAAVVAATAIATTTAWDRGWQPADVLRLVARRHGDLEQDLTRDVMGHELAQYAAATIDRQWTAQLRQLEVRTWWDASSTYLEARRSMGTDPISLLGAAITVLHTMCALPELERLTPIPGEVVDGAGAERVRDADRPVVDERILTRVRQLLAKAESTTFEAEADTFTAGAQALMARHSIDAALLAAQGTGTRGRDEARGRRIGVDAPYDAPKAMLLNAVASANRCRMVWSRELGFGTIVGFEADLESVEVLYTSLLVQATKAMTAAGSRRDHRGNSRTRSFRHSFLMAYADRIGERLAQVMSEEVHRASGASVASGRELVPVLAERAEQVERAVEDWFPSLSARPVSAGRDAEGWHSGRAAANRAELGSAAAVGG